MFRFAVWSFTCLLGLVLASPAAAYCASSKQVAFQDGAIGCVVYFGETVITQTATRSLEENVLSQKTREADASYIVVHMLGDEAPQLRGSEIAQRARGVCKAFENRSRELIGEPGIYMSAIQFVWTTTPNRRPTTANTAANVTFYMNKRCRIGGKS